METQEKSIALGEHLPSVEIIKNLVRQFNIEEEVALGCMRGIVGSKENLETGLWSLYEKDGEFFLIRENNREKKTGGVYRIYTAPGKRFDKTTKNMVETVYLQYERTHRKPAELTANSIAGNNETGHYLPPGGSGRR